VSKRFPFVSFVSLDTPDQFKMAFFSSLSNGGGVSPYVVLSSDDVVVKEEVVLTPCIEAMRKSSAYGFYFHLGALSSLQTQEAIFSWMIEKGKEQWREPNKLKMALYRKVDLERDFRTVSLRSKEDLIRFWEKNEGRYLGLSFDHSKIDEN